MSLTHRHVQGMRQRYQAATNPTTTTTTSTTTSTIVDGNTDSLPQTLVQAMAPTQRAIVITESTSPYRVWNVNSAWQQLCGYSLSEARHYTLGSLLANSEVNSVKAVDLAQQLSSLVLEQPQPQGPRQVEATLVNYKKWGRRFVDHLRLGPLVDARGRVTHFVGVVEEVTTAA